MFSTSGTRAAIATALSSVSGVRGLQRAPQTPRAGSAWPEFIGAVRGPGDAWETNWRIVVLLSGDPRTEDAKVDQLAPLIFDALDPIVFTDAMSVDTVNTSAGEWPSLQIIARGE